MSDLWDIIFTKADTKEGKFVTIDGRPVFIGGPGQGGGGSSESSGPNIVMQNDPSLGEFVSLNLWLDQNVDTKNIPVYVDHNDIPPVRDGYTRLYHGTQDYYMQSIVNTGLKPGAETGEKEGLETILSVVGEPSGFGGVNIVFDVPSNEVNMLNDSWGEVNHSISPENFTGILVGKRQSSNIPRLAQLYNEYGKLYGD